MPFDTFRRAKRRWRGVCGMSAMAPRQGYRGAALLARQPRWCIHGAQAAAHHPWRGVGGAFQRAGGDVDDSTKAELWWGRCWGSGR